MYWKSTGANNKGKGILQLGHGQYNLSDSPFGLGPVIFRARFLIWKPAQARWMDKDKLITREEIQQNTRGLETLSTVLKYPKTYVPWYLVQR